MAPVALSIPDYLAVSICIAVLLHAANIGIGIVNFYYQQRLEKKKAKHVMEHQAQYEAAIIQAIRDGRAVFANPTPGVAEALAEAQRPDASKLN